MSMSWPVEIAAKYSVEELAQLEIGYKNCSIIRQLLSEVLTKEIERVRMATESSAFLTEPNLSERRAWNDGSIAGFRRALTLLNLTEVNKQ